MIDSNEIITDLSQIDINVIIHVILENMRHTTYVCTHKILHMNVYVDKYMMYACISDSNEIIKDSGCDLGFDGHLSTHLIDFHIISLLLVIN